MNHEIRWNQEISYRVLLLFLMGPAPHKPSSLYGDLGFVIASCIL